jgi:hypothetical protein
MSPLGVMSSKKASYSSGLISVSIMSPYELPLMVCSGISQSQEDCLFCYGVSSGFGASACPPQVGVTLRCSLDQFCL